jgi:NADPH-dependent curcumin reductase CurA
MSAGVVNRQLLLTRYADNLPGEEHFTLTESPVGTPDEGQVLVKVLYLSMDPAPRMRMSGGSALPQLPLNTVMIGRGIGQVVASRDPRYPEGAFVMGEPGWQEYACIPADGLRLIDPSLGPLPAHLGALGNSGLAAYFATLRQGSPKPGETLVINAAAGSVASIAGQIARIHGVRVVGIAGGSVQLDYLRNDLRFDAAVDYQAPDFASQLSAALPNGVDVFLDLVGGETHDAVMRHLNVHARIVLVGVIASYNRPPDEVDTGQRHLLTWINRRVRLSGFLVGDYAAEFPDALRQIAAWIREGRIVTRETVFDGLEACPHAFRALFGSDHVGKLLVRL